MDTEIRKENKVQTGCDQFTSPEEISALSKYLKKKRQALDDSINLGKDNLGVPGWRSGSLKEITSLSDKVEVLDTRGNSGIISKLKDSRETLTTNKNVGTLEKQRETILGNKKETTLDDDIENIAPGEKNTSLGTKREDLKINDKTSLSGYIDSIIDNQKDPSLSNDRLDIGEIKDPNLKKERENVYFAKEIDKNLSLKRGKDTIVDLEIDEKQKLDYNLRERLKVEKTVDALQNKLLDIGKNFSENELKQQEGNIIKGASDNGSLIWLSGEKKEIESLKKPKNNIEGELPKLKSLGENKPVSSAINENGEVETLKKTKNITIPGKIKDQPLSDTRENIDIIELEKLSKDRENLGIKEKTELSSFRSDIKVEDEKGVKLSKEREDINDVKKVEIIGEPAKKLINKPKEEDEIKLEKDIESVQGKIRKDELNTSKENIIGQVKEIKKLNSEPELLDIGKKNIFLEDKKEKINGDILELKKLNQEKENIEVSDKVQELNTKQEEVIDYPDPEDDKIKLSGEAINIKKELEDKEVSELESRVDRIDTKEIRNLDSSLEQIQDKGKILDTPELSTTHEKIDPKLIDSLDNDHLETLTPQVDINLPDQPAKKIIESGDKISALEDNKERVVINENIEPDKLSNTRLDLEEKEVDKLSDNSIKVLDGDKEIEDLSQNLENITESITELEELSKKLVSVEDISEIERLEDNKEQVVNNENIEPDKLSNTRLDLEEKEVDNLSNTRLDLTTEDVDLSDILLDISPNDIDSLSNKLIDLEVTDKFNFEGEEDTNIDFRGEGLSKERLDLNTEDVDLEDELKPILPDSTTKLNGEGKADHAQFNPDTDSLYDIALAVTETDIYNFEGQVDTNIDFKNEGLSKERLDLTTEDQDSLSDIRKNITPDDLDKINYGSNYKRDEEDDETRDDYKHTGFQDSLSKSREDVESDDTSKTNLSSDGTHAQFDPEKDKLYEENIKTAKDDTTKLNGEGKADHAQFETLENGSLYDTNLGINETDKFNFSDNTEQGSDNENLAWNKELSDNLENASKDDESIDHKQFNPETDTLYRSAEKAKDNDVDKINYGPNHKRDEEDDPTRDDYKHTGFQDSLSKSREDVEEEGDEHRQFDPDSDSLYDLAIQAEEDEKNTAENLKTILNSRNKSLEQYYNNILRFADNKALDKGWASKVKSLMSAYLSGGEVTKARAEEFEQQLFKTILGDQGNVQMAEYKLCVSWTNGINASKYLRYVAEQAAGLVKSTSGTWVFGPNPYGKSSLRQTLLDTTLMTLVAARRVLEVSTKSNRDRLPGKDVGILQDVIGGGGTKELAKKAASKLTKSVINNVASAFGAQQIDTSLPMNRPEKWKDEKGWEYGNNRTNTSRGDKNSKDKNKSNSFSLKKLGNALAAAAGEALLGAAGKEEYDFKSNYMQGWGITTTLQDLAGVKPSTVESVEDLRAAIKSSPYMNEPTKFTSSKQNPGGNLITLDDNTHWEIILEPFCGEENGGYSYLPSLAEINIWNAAHHGVNTGYNKWIPFTSFDLSKSKMSTKSLNLFDGEIVYPISMEFTNELRLTIADDAYKSWRTYFERCSDAAIYSSEPHKIDYYSKESIGFGIGSSLVVLFSGPDPAGITAIDKSYICPALYKNVTFRCIIYSLTPQLSTISKYDLLVVLRDFVEERTGDIDSGGSDLNLVFSIVGENPTAELKTTNSYSAANNARKAQLKKDKIKDKVNLATKDKVNLATSVVSTALSPVLKVVGL